MNHDITFCTRDCKNVKCFRNKSNIDPRVASRKPLSYCNFEQCKEFIKKHKSEAT